MFVCSSLYTQFQRYSGPNTNMKFFNENYQKYVNFSHFISSQQLGYFFGPNALMRGKNADSIFTAFLLFINYGSYSFHLSKKIKSSYSSNYYESESLILFIHRLYDLNCVNCAINKIPFVSN